MKQLVFQCYICNQITQLVRAGYAQSATLKMEAAEG
jgi:hypothetical protein